MICSAQFTFGFEESALNAKTVIKIIPIMPTAKKMHEGKLISPASIVEMFKFAMSTMSAVIRKRNPIGIKIRICTNISHIFFFATAAISFQSTLNIPETRHINAPITNNMLLKRLPTLIADSPKNITGIRSNIARATLKPLGIVFFVILFFRCLFIFSTYKL